MEAKLELKSRRERSACPQLYNLPRTDTFCGRVHLMRCTISAYRDPIPEGRMGVLERDGAAATIAARWPSTVTCAWHEYSRYLGKIDSCPCAMCSDARKPTTPRSAEVRP